MTAIHFDVSKGLYLHLLFVRTNL